MDFDGPEKENVCQPVAIGLKRDLASEEHPQEITAGGKSIANGAFQHCSRQHVMTALQQTAEYKDMGMAHISRSLVPLLTGNRGPADKLLHCARIIFLCEFDCILECVGKCVCLGPFGSQVPSLLSRAY